MDMLIQHSIAKSEPLT